MKNFNYDSAKAWVEDGRFPQKGYRPTYDSKYGRITLITPEYLEKIKARYHAFIRDPKQWTKYIAIEPTTFETNGRVINLIPNRAIVYSLKLMGVEHDMSEFSKLFEACSQYLVDTNNNRLWGVEQTINRAEEFFKVGSYALTSYSREQPLIVWHEDGSRTFASETPLRVSGHAKLMIERYGSVNPRDYRQDIEEPVNGIVLTVRKGMGYMTTRHTPVTKVKGRCTECYGKNYVISDCTIGMVNSRMSWGYNKDRLMSEYAHVIDTVVQVKGEKSQFTYSVLKCKHGQSEDHKDWTNIQECSSCTLDGPTRLVDKLSGYRWSGLPVTYSKEGEVINSITPIDTKIVPVPAVNRWLASWAVSHVNGPSEQTTTTDF